MRVQWAQDTSIYFYDLCFLTLHFVIVNRASYENDEFLKKIQGKIVPVNVNFSMQKFSLKVLVVEIKSNTSPGVVPATDAPELELYSFFLW